MIINKFIYITDLEEIDLFLHSMHLPFNSFIFVFRLSAILITFHNSTFLTTFGRGDWVCQCRDKGVSW